MGYPITHYEVEHCDGSHDDSRPRNVRRLNLPGGAGVNYCRECWHKEMRRRQEQNQFLSPEGRWSLISWYDWQCPTCLRPRGTVSAAGGEPMCECEVGDV